ncbi:MAG TPA: hypothetical protein O0X70_08270, partial [Methanocorpusculum sp.]|nr:hypothetical protein [Methanocorpusculum sp.]
ASVLYQHLQSFSNVVPNCSFSPMHRSVFRQYSSALLLLIHLFKNFLSAFPISDNPSVANGDQFLDKSFLGAYHTGICDSSSRISYSIFNHLPNQPHPAKSTFFRENPVICLTFSALRVSNTHAQSSQIQAKTRRHHNEHRKAQQHA